MSVDLDSALRLTYLYETQNFYSHIFTVLGLVRCPQFGPIR